MSHDVRHRRDLARQVLAQAASTGCADLHCDALAAAHLGSWTPDNLDQREAWAREHLAIATQVADPLRVHDARMDLLADLLERGDRPGVNLLLDEHERAAASTPNLILEWHAAHYACLRAILDDRLDNAEQELGRARALGQQAGYEIADAWHAVQLVSLSWRRPRLGDRAAALASLAVAQPTHPWVGAAALAAAEGGRPDPSHAVVRRYVIGDRLALPRDFTWLVTACLLLEVCQRAGRTDAEQATRRALEPYSGRHASLYAMTSWGPVASFLAGRGETKPFQG
jgi:hypothetical protein